MTVILINKNQIEFISKSKKHRINLSVPSFVKLIQKKKYLKFLTALNTDTITIYYKDPIDYYFFTGFVANTIKLIKD